ncbi:MAG: hypothetical protein ACREBR_03590, partial [bacterium]
MGQAHWFLSLRITQRADYSTTVDQSRYAKAITVRYTEKINFHMDAKYNRILPPQWTASKKNCSPSEKERESLEKYYNLDYRSLTGALIYLNFTRPDIVFAVMKLVKFNNNPGKSHFEALIHLLGYLRDNPSLGLRFYSNLDDAPVTRLLKDHNMKRLICLQRLVMAGLPRHWSQYRQLRHILSRRRCRSLLFRSRP